VIEPIYSWALLVNAPLTWANVEKPQVSDGVVEVKKTPQFPRFARVRIGQRADLRDQSGI
jgi:hypothetical protein